MSFANVPKDFLTKLYIGSGPWGPGPYAEPCYCGRRLDDGNPVCIMKSNTGGVMICHEECVEGIEDA